MYEELRLWVWGGKTNSGKRQFDVTEIFIPRSFVYTFIVKIESTVEGALTLSLSLLLCFIFLGALPSSSAVAAAVPGRGRKKWSKSGNNSKLFNAEKPRVRTHWGAARAKKSFSVFSLHTALCSAAVVLLLSTVCWSCFALTLFLLFMLLRCRFTCSSSSALYFNSEWIHCLKRINFCGGVAGADTQHTRLSLRLFESCFYAAVLCVWTNSRQSKMCEEKLPKDNNEK